MSRKSLWLAGALLVVCCRRPSSMQTKPTGTPSTAVANEQRFYRLTEHAQEASVKGPLGAGWQALSYPAKFASPYHTGGDPESDPRVVELALADADVANFAGESPPAHPSNLHFDPVWNRTRAIYESKRALFAPAPTCYRFHPPALPEAELRFSFAVPPGGAAVEFSVEVDGHQRYSHETKPTETGAWLPTSIPLAGAHQIALCTRSAHELAGAFWGSPLIYAKQPMSDKSSHYNVLFVVIDTLRKDAMAVMPRLSALAKRSACFEQAITAATWTRPSILAMLGGDLPTAVGQSAEEMIPTDAARQRFYAAKRPLLPRLLQKEGYLAKAIGNNFFFLGYPQIGLSLDYDEVTDIRHPVLDTPAITTAAVRFFRDHADERWFLYLHYDAPHWPYVPPPQYLAQVTPPDDFPADAATRAYLAEAAYADDYLGRVLDELDRLHLSERTLVIVVGDHGEIFDHAHDHLVEALKFPTLHHHGWSAYDEILRVPLVISLPGIIPPARVATQVSLVDLTPTLLELLRMPPILGARGRSLVPLWRGETAAEQPAFTEGQNVRSVRAGGWAYLRRSDGRIRKGSQRLRIDEELYDLTHDPSEHVNRAQTDPIKLEQMRALFAKEAPVPPEVAESVAHLRTAPDVRPHQFEGLIRSPGTLAVSGVERAEVAPLDSHRMKIQLREDAKIDFVVDPPSAPIELELRRDGIPIGPKELLLGRFGLPLLRDQTALRIAGERLAWLNAEHSPALGKHGDVLLWRDPSSSSSSSVAVGRKTSEVADMMQRWGYAQPAQAK